MIVWIDPKTKEKHWLIPKDELQVGAYYVGKCRNGRVARWNGEFFVYWREKFGNRFTETIFHPQDDNGFDLFIPEQYLCGPEGFTIPLSEKNDMRPWEPPSKDTDPS